MNTVRAPIQFAALLAALLAASAAGAAGEWSAAGDIGLELRYFGQDPQYAGQEGGLEGSTALNLEAAWFGDHSRASLQPFLRLDSVDSQRSHFDLREAYWAYGGAGWEVLVGLNKVFWGVTESRHLVDIINQTDLVEDPDQEQKLGQPMVRALLERDWGQLEFYLMPWFRERTFPGESGRLRPPLVVDTNAAIYESAAEEHHADIALRWSHYFGDVDFGVHAFHGTGREPKLLVFPDGQRLVPFYFRTTQAGVDVQYTHGAWLWKLEVLSRDGLEDRYSAGVAGFEYTLYGLRGGASDLGLLTEYLHDGRGEREPVTLFDDDWFVGVRWALNDSQDSSLLAGVVLDRDTSEWFFSLEAERRLGEVYFAELTVRLFNGDENEALGMFDQDDYVELSLVRYF